jgi:hypothetical protein
VYGAFIVYYVYTVRNMMGCDSEKKDELPCPNTCNPGYECTQTETPNEFVIGDVVEENLFDGVEQSREDADATEESSAEEGVIRLDV